jgi:hypothetical protein
MSLEFDPTSPSAFIDDLSPTNPPGTDPKAQGDDHLRAIKKALKNTFPRLDKTFDDVYAPQAPNLFLNPEFRFTKGCEQGDDVTGYVAEQWRVRNDVTSSDYSFSTVLDQLNYAQPGAYLLFSSDTNRSAGDFGFEQSIEDVTLFGGKKVAVSLFVRCMPGAANDLTLTARAVQQFDTPNGGSASVTVDSETDPQTVAVGTDGRLTFLFDFPSVAGKTLGTNGLAGTRTTFQFLFSTGATVARFMTAKCEIIPSLSASSTAYNAPSPGEQEASLQRYYQEQDIFGLAAVAFTEGRASTDIQFPVTMRITPTLTVTDGEVWTASRGWLVSNIDWSNTEFASSKAGAKLDAARSETFTVGEAVRFKGVFKFNARWP